MTGAPVRLAAFAAVLALAFGGAALAGSAVGPEPAEPAEPTESAHGEAPAGGHGQDAAGHDSAAPAGETLPGLAVAADGLRLALDDTTVAGAGRHALAFRILGEDGRAVRDFDVEHDKRLHLIVVRRDLTGFQHLHPRMDDDGRWSADVTLPEAGTYRVLADFTIDGRKRTLGADLQVPGRFTPRALPARADQTTDDRGLTVRRGIEKDDIVTFQVFRDGRLVNDELEPYLGAKGHLVTLRAGDLAYLHTHPEADRLAFAVDPRGPGTYRSWVQFQLDGTVHTAAFTEEISR